MDGNLGKRTAAMAAGIAIIGLSVGFYRLSGFGVDAFTCMNLGISGFLNVGFGSWQLIVNAVILIAVFFLCRECIGAGTIVNMICVGYEADFLCWLAQDVVRVDMILPMRIGALIFGCLFAGLGVALYMAAGMGTAPYDSTAVVLEKITRGRLPFQYARVCTDATAVAVGIIFCLAAENSLWQIVGIGTICNACLNGPLIQFFRSHICEPLLTGKN